MPETSETLHLLALSRTPGVGHVLAKQLISYCGSAQGVFAQSKGRLMKVPGIGERLAEAVLHSDALKWAESALKMADSHAVNVISYLDAHYPQRLKPLPDAPLVLFFKGHLACLNTRQAVGIVGTRQATAYGKEMAERLVAELQPYQGTSIVSGMAYGIDVCAHKEALKHAMPTLGVMANGLGMVYPQTHAKIAEQMIEAGGGLLSEHPIDAKPETHYFPARNRIIAGLCDAVVVVEARSQGGALITAKLANDYDREVFAFPGNADKETSRGCHALIQQHHAHLITQAADLTKCMGWTLEGDTLLAPKRMPAINFDSEEEAMLYQALKHGAQHIDLLSLQTGLSMTALASQLLQLEFKGLVKAMPGKKFEWIDKNQRHH